MQAKDARNTNNKEAILLIAFYISLCRYYLSENKKECEKQCGSGSEKRAKKQSGSESEKESEEQCGSEYKKERRNSAGAKVKGERETERERK